mgnify:CR=1 FL=1
MSSSRRLYFSPWAVTGPSMDGVLRALEPGSREITRLLRSLWVCVSSRSVTAMAVTNTMTELAWPPVHWNEEVLGGQVMAVGGDDPARLTVHYRSDATMVTEHFPRGVTDLTVTGYNGPLTAIPRWITSLKIERPESHHLCPLQESDFIPGGYDVWRGDRSLVPQLRNDCPPPTRSSGLPDGLKVLRISYNCLRSITGLPNGLEEFYCDSHGEANVCYSLPGGDSGVGLSRVPGSLRVLSIGVLGHCHESIQKIVPDSVQELTLFGVPPWMFLDLSFLPQATDLTIIFVRRPRQMGPRQEIVLPQSLRRLTLRHGGPKINIGRAPLLEALEIGYLPATALTNGVKVSNIDEYAQAWRTAKSARSANVVPESVWSEEGSPHDYVLEVTEPVGGGILTG